MRRIELGKQVREDVEGYTWLARAKKIMRGMQATLHHTIQKALEDDDLPKPFHFGAFFPSPWQLLLIGRWRSDFESVVFSIINGFQL